MSQKTIKGLKKAGEEVYERLLELPMWEEFEKEQSRGSAVTSTDGQQLRDIVKQFKNPLHPELIHKYREWLVEDSPDSSRWSYETIPIERGECCC